MVRTAPPEHRRLPVAAKLVLFVLLPLVIVVALVAAVASAVPLLVAAPVSLDLRAEAGAVVRVEVPDARIDVEAGSADEVAVEVTGTYSGPEPDLEVETVGDETRVEGGCPPAPFSRCALQLQVSVPESSELIVRGTNGQVTVTGLSGAVDVETRNGRLDVDDASGPLTLTTTNGAIRLTDGASERVTARTTNGGVELDFMEAPGVVEAETTNGGITVRVPDDGEDYFVDARTTNGSVDDAGVPSDRTAERTITARTTNGGITVERR
ncbi:DUF4097 family beta strand repeat-containing protein [Naasia sp. SYSU D00948]|uniref:DUF4097 family beta strand repeat-containing protein n=1 Tax=Naasia sp. SYSU D00948 TaxID=2817379 RepID=UPI001B314AA2|nr:DUF4097 family beta strand repeat-containing protein [Naasia sp. SYSU D00948]